MVGLTGGQLAGIAIGVMMFVCWLLTKSWRLRGDIEAVPARDPTLLRPDLTIAEAERRIRAWDELNESVRAVLPPEKHAEIQALRDELAGRRRAGDGTGDHPCACCGYRTLGEPGHESYEICPICFWEDDPVQFRNPDVEGGANAPSLRQAQANFAEFGACDRGCLPHVRPPGPDDRRADEWEPL